MITDASGARLWLFAACVAASCLAHAEDSDSTAGFWRYRDALLAADGTAAWHAVDSHTKSYYNQIVKDALAAPRSELSRMDLMTKFTVLRTRVEFPSSELETMSGERLFTIGVERGWISRSTVQGITELKVVRDDGRVAALALPAQPNFPVFHLLKEDAEWKVALSLSFDLGNLALKKMAQDAQMTDDEFILAVIRKVSRFEVGEDVFDGPTKE